VINKVAEVAHVSELLPLAPYVFKEAIYLTQEWKGGGSWLLTKIVEQVCPRQSHSCMLLKVVKTYETPGRRCPRLISVGQPQLVKRAPLQSRNGRHKDGEGRSAAPGSQKSRTVPRLAIKDAALFQHCPPV
jgi:hypothetical protein